MTVYEFGEIPAQWPIPKNGASVRITEIRWYLTSSVTPCVTNRGTADRGYGHLAPLRGALEPADAYPQQVGHALGDKVRDGERYIAAAAVRLGCRSSPTTAGSTAALVLHHGRAGRLVPLGE